MSRQVERRKGRLDLGTQELEFACYEVRPGSAPVIVLLHEGLGSVSLWKAFPAKLAAATGENVAVYSRAGYGESTPVELPRPLDYMQREAVDVLPRVLDQLGFERGVLLGHSDGASIAAYYAGSVPDRRVRGLVLFAPHFFVEEMTVAEIARTRERWQTTDLRMRLGRHHHDVDNAFLGWNGAWLDPEFRKWETTECLAYIRVPVLVVQGAADPYGTLAQVRAMERECICPLETVVLPGVGHSPQFEAPEATLEVTSAFVRHLLELDASPGARGREPALASGGRR